MALDAKMRASSAPIPADAPVTAYMIGNADAFLFRALVRGHIADAQGCV